MIERQFLIRRAIRRARRLPCLLGVHHWFYTADGAPHRPYRFCRACYRGSRNYLDGTPRW